MWWTVLLCSCAACGDMMRNLRFMCVRLCCSHHTRPPVKALKPWWALADDSSFNLFMVFVVVDFLNHHLFERTQWIMINQEIRKCLSL